MSIRQHLQKRHNTWMVVVEVPKPLRKAAGKARFIKSLGTDSLSKANALKLPYVAEFKRQINRLERERPDKLAQVRMAALELRKLIADTPDIERDDDYGFNLHRHFFEQGLELGKDTAEEHGAEAGREVKAILSGKATFLKDLQPTWLSEVVAKREQTKDQHRYAVERYRAWAGEGVTIETTTRKKAGEYVGHLLATSGLTRRTIERHASSLSTFWKWLYARGHINEPVNPWLGHGLGSKKGRKRTRKALTDDMLVKLLSHKYVSVSSDRYQQVLPDLLRLTLLSGARIGEWCELERTDVEERADGWWINIGEGKTDAAERSVPLLAQAVPIITRRLEDGDRHLFANLIPGGQDNKRGHNVSKAYLRFRKQAGVAERWQDFHALRHTFTSVMEGCEVAESTVKLIIGHARESLTFGHYSEGDRVNLRTAINKLAYSPAVMNAITRE